MSDYISRDELLELYAPDPDCDKCSVPFPVARQNILDMPAADVVEVTFCKDCRYYQDAKVNEKGFLICPASGMEITKTDYCSYGERMDKEDKHETD